MPAHRDACARHRGLDRGHEVPQRRGFILFGREEDERSLVVEPDLPSERHAGGRSQGRESIEGGVTGETHVALRHAGGDHVGRGDPASDTHDVRDDIRHERGVDPRVQPEHILDPDRRDAHLLGHAQGGALGFRRRRGDDDVGLPQLDRAAHRTELQKGVTSVSRIAIPGLGLAQPVDEVLEGQAEVRGRLLLGDSGPRIV